MQPTQRPSFHQNSQEVLHRYLTRPQTPRLPEQLSNLIITYIREVILNDLPKEREQDTIVLSFDLHRFYK